MNTLKFKTNIKCSGCISKVTPALNDKVGEGNWEVDIMTLKKTLTIKAPDNITQDDVIKTVRTAGFEAEPM